MDTSKKYIKMCEKTEEIQTLYKPDEPNFLWDSQLRNDWDKDSKKYIGRRLVFGGIFQVFSTYDGYEWTAIWLPRQDQLQEMVEERKNTYFLIEDFSDFMLDNLLEDHGNVPYTPPFKAEWEKASMEQLWLAFVMHEKYKKQWSDENNEWIVNESNIPTR